MERTGRVWYNSYNSTLIDLHLVKITQHPGLQMTTMKMFSTELRLFCSELRIIVLPVTLVIQSFGVQKILPFCSTLKKKTFRTRTSKDFMIRIFRRKTYLFLSQCYIFFKVGTFYHIYILARATSFLIKK